jgi:nucleotide-binding universal stress UspA family protein
MAIERIRVPLDFSEQADRALPVAVTLAERLDARLGAVVVTGARVDPELDEREARRHARRAGCVLDDVVVRTGDDVVAGILAACSPTTLLCLATNARGPAVDLVARSVGDQVLCRSTRPVLAVGPAVPDGPWPGVDRLVCCVDGDDPATDRLLAATADWALGLGCESHLVRVIPPGGAGIDVLDARERLDDVVRRLWARGLPATSALVTAADVDAGIVRCAAQGDGTLLVMASHGTSGLARLRLGSVTLDVVRRATAPVLVFPVHTQPTSWSPPRHQREPVGSRR